MKPETERFLAAADQALIHSARILAIDIPLQVARLSYLARFHAAQALILERTGKIAKTHKGVSRLFHKTAADEPNLSPRLAAQLSAAYYFKEAADYDVSAEREVSSERASAELAEAQAFVAAIRNVL
jgi:uncharacterized protein (UPF0332 family)